MLKIGLRLEIFAKWDSAKKKKWHIHLDKFACEKCIRPHDYKTFSMLNSAEHEILNAHKYINIKKFSFFQAQISL